MRVARALAKLRSDLAKRGVRSGEEALASSLAAQATLAIASPAALEVASRALAGAHLLPGAESTAAKLLQLVKSPAVVPWAGLGAMIAVFSSAWFAVSRAERPVPAHSTAVPATSEDAPASNQSPGPAGETASTAPVSAQGPGPSAASADPGSVGRFADLSDPEKHILKTLWDLNSELGAMPGSQFGLEVGPSAPKAADFSAGQALLLMRGLVRYGRNRRAVRFTPAGFEYCRIHREEIDDYPAFYHPASGPSD